MTQLLRRVLGRSTLGGYRVVHDVSAKLFSLGVGGAFASFGRRTVIEPPVRIGGEARIAIGSDVFIGANSWLQTLPPDTGLAIEIGDGTSIAGNCVLSAVRSVRLGRAVLIARGVYISDHIHAYNDPTRPVLGQGTAKVEAVEIGDGAWLGENVVIGPGVRIGRGAVVGGNAVVLEDVPEYSLAVGVPARVIRTFASGERSYA